MPNQQEDPSHILRTSDSDSSAPANTNVGGGGMEGDGSTAGSSGWVTRCVCGRNNEQEGFMIECEGCEVWQHGHCVGVSKNNVPKHYYCERCKPEMHPIPTRKPSKTKNNKRKRNPKTKGPNASVDTKKQRRASTGTAAANITSAAPTPTKTNDRAADRAAEALMDTVGVSTEGLAASAPDAYAAATTAAAELPSTTLMGVAAPREGDTTDNAENGKLLSREDKKIMKIMQTIQLMEDREQKKKTFTDRRRRSSKSKTGAAGGATKGSSPTGSRNNNSNSSRRLSTNEADRSLPNNNKGESGAKSVDESFVSEWEGFYNFDDIRRSPTLLRSFFPLSPMYLGRKVWLMQKVKNENLDVSNEKTLQLHSNEKLLPLKKRVMHQYFTEHSSTASTTAGLQEQHQDQEHEQQRQPEEQEQEQEMDIVSPSASESAGAAAFKSDPSRHLQDEMEVDDGENSVSSLTEVEGVRGSAVVSAVSSPPSSPLVTSGVASVNVSVSPNSSMPPSALQSPANEEVMDDMEDTEHSLPPSAAVTSTDDKAEAEFRSAITETQRDASVPSAAPIEAAPSPATTQPKPLEESAVPVPVSSSEVEATLPAMETLPPTAAAVTAEPLPPFPPATESPAVPEAAPASPPPPPPPPETVKDERVVESTAPPAPVQEPVPPSAPMSSVSSSVTTPRPPSRSSSSSSVPVPIPVPTPVPTPASAPAPAPPPDPAPDPAPVQAPALAPAPVPTPSQSTLSHAPPPPPLAPAPAPASASAAVGGISRGCLLSSAFSSESLTMSAAKPISNLTELMQIHLDSQNQEQNGNNGAVGVGGASSSSVAPPSSVTSSAERFVSCCFGRCFYCFLLIAVSMCLRRCFLEAVPRRAFLLAAQECEVLGRRVRGNPLAAVAAAAAAGGVSMAWPPLPLLFEHQHSPRLRPRPRLLLPLLLLLVPLGAGSASGRL